jgi:hypothetical protein
MACGVFYRPDKVAARPRWVAAGCDPRAGRKRATTPGEGDGMSDLSADDRLAIHEVLSRYCHSIDRGRWDEFGELFTDDCRLDLSQVMGLYEGKAGIQTFAETIRKIGIFMRHITTNVVIRGDGQRARAESYVIAITGSEANANQTTGFYDDELVKVGGRWRLRSRRLALDVPKT